MTLDELKDEVSRILEVDAQSSNRTERTSIFDLGDKFVVEVVLSDAALVSKLKEALSTLSSKSDKHIDVRVRSSWGITDVGDPVPAYGPDGGLRAAVLLPVQLSSGSSETVVTVAITKMAEMTLQEMLGRKITREILQSIAQRFVESLLRKGGLSYWDPVRSPYQEISASVATSMSLSTKNLQSWPGAA